MEKFKENNDEGDNQWLTEDENKRFSELSHTVNTSHKELEEKSRLELLADLRKREVEGTEPKTQGEKDLIEGLKKTFSPEITDNDIRQQ